MHGTLLKSMIFY